MDWISFALGVVVGYIGAIALAAYLTYRDGVRGH